MFETDEEVPLTLGVGGPVIGTASIAEDGTIAADVTDPDVVAALRPTVSAFSIGAAASRIDPDRACPHPDFAANVEVNRLTKSDDDPTVVAYDTSITVSCLQCGEPFRWIGVQAGLNSGRPMCSVDETELRAPVRPASADPDFGLGLPGFAVTWRGGDDD